MEPETINGSQYIMEFFDRGIGLPIMKVGEIGHHIPRNVIMRYSKEGDTVAASFDLVGRGLN